uniref:Uncharacterized protein n=1 Tax=Cucumis melo TaxID=3656 RepID=A0A9I9E7X8_CUCME
MPLVMCQEMFKTPDIFILAWKLEEFGVNGFDAENELNKFLGPETLLTAAEETISYKILIVATGARALKLEEFGVNGPDAMSLSFLCFFASQIVDEDDKNATAGKLTQTEELVTETGTKYVGGGYVIAEFWHFIRFDLPFKIMVSQVTFGTDGLVMASVSRELSSLLNGEQARNRFDRDILKLYAWFVEGITKHSICKHSFGRKDSRYINY